MPVEQGIAARTDDPCQYQYLKAVYSLTGHGSDLPTSEAPDGRARSPEEGGPALWDTSTIESRERRLGAPGVRPERDGASVAAMPHAAHEAV